MKHTLLRLACFFMRGVLRLYGWRDEPKPLPYTASDKYPWWRKTKGTHIEVESFTGAIIRCIKESVKPLVPAGGWESKALNKEQPPNA